METRTENRRKYHRLLVVLRQLSSETLILQLRTNSLEVHMCRLTLYWLIRKNSQQGKNTDAGYLSDYQRYVSVSKPQNTTTEILLQIEVIKSVRTLKDSTRI